MATQEQVCIYIYIFFFFEKATSIFFDLHYCLNGTEYSDGLLINIMFCTTFNGVLQVKHDWLVLESMDTITDKYEYL